MALTGAPDHLALDSSGRAAVEKGAHTTPASPAHSHARTLVRTHSGTVTSEPASLGIQIQFGCLPPPVLQSSSPTSLPAPCSWFPFRNLQTFPADQYLYWLFIVREPCVFGDPACRGSSRSLLQGRKNSRRREGPSSCWVCGCRQHRKEEKRKAPASEGADKGGGERGSNSKKNQAMAAHLVPGLGWEETPILGLLFRARCPGLPLLGEPEVTHSFGISYVRALGGFLGLLTGEEESGRGEVRHDCFQLPGGGHAVAWLAWNSLQLCDGTRRENN